MAQPHDRFAIGDFLMFFLVRGDPQAGTLKRIPEELHMYWYAKLEGDETLIAIPDRDVAFIARPSDAFIKGYGDMLAKLKAEGERLKKEQEQDVSEPENE